MKTGIQFYMFIELIKQNKVEEAIELAAQSGVDGVEFFSYLDLPEGTKPLTLRKALNNAGVVCCGCHNHLKPLLENLDFIMEYNYILGNKNVLCHWLIEKTERGSKENYLRAADAFNKIAFKLKQNGFDFSFHNHGFEFEEVFDGQRGHDILLKNTDPHLVGFELHIGALPPFGLDIVDYIKNVLGYRLKLLHVHTKTFGPNMSLVDFDSAPAIKASRELGVPWAILESMYKPFDYEQLKADVSWVRQTGNKD
ncbi:MAG: sugar phosphate isomerase/epimerase [Clostridiales bacterium]|jgi:sugar phosphate isomerase/epimerase|nr:sugar phosphate isomerase/epimerase [Clostridiales bacterium]